MSNNQYLSTEYFVPHLINRALCTQRKEERKSRRLSHTTQSKIPSAAGSTTSAIYRTHHPKMAAPALVPALDHIVLLVPHHVLVSLPAWLTSALRVLDGGRHADGATENKLVVFPDGAYIELIAFVPGRDPAQRARHRWGRLAEGRIIDFALTLLEPSDSDSGAEDDPPAPEEDFSRVQDRVRAAGTGITYGDPQAGGRVRPDGVELRWAVASARVEKGEEEDRGRTEPLGAGQLPFWCLDRTPRGLRVPHLDPENVDHPSGAVGVAGVTVSARGRDHLRRLRKVYEAITDKEAKLVEGEADRLESHWNVQVPVPRRSLPAKLVLKGLTDEEASDISISQFQDSPAEIVIELSLYTVGDAREIRGHFGNGIDVVINLIAIG